MEAKVTWNSGLSFTGLAESGFPIALDGGPDLDGHAQGSSPMELFAVGLAGCTAMDVISILEKKRQQVTAFEVLVHAERAEEHPKVFKKITVEYIITGHGIDPAAVERAIQLSEEKYCPGQAMLRASVDIDHTYKIREPEEELKIDD